MSNLVDILNIICAEIRSDKVNIRNKAMEQLDTYLTSHKSELLQQLSKNHEDGISWTTVFTSTIDSTIKHAIKLDEMKESKSYQAMRNKNYIYNTIISKLINYNLEDVNPLMTKTTLFNAFVEGFQCRAAVKHFNQLFLNILDLGIYKSPLYLSQLQANEFSIILSHLFETNKGDDCLFQLNSLKTITRTIEISQRYTLINDDIMEYFPNIIQFSKNSPDDSRKDDIIKLYYLVISHYSVDYHYTICSALQQILPEICGFYHYNMRSATKELFFKFIVISLHTLYPFIHSENGETIQVKLEDNWPKTLKKMKSIMDLETEEQNNAHYQNSKHQNDSLTKSFVQMSSLIVFLLYWDIKKKETNDESHSKIPKLTDKIEVVLDFLLPTGGNFNETWLAILAELLTHMKSIMDVHNIQQILSTLCKVLKDYRNGKNLKNIRLCLSAILRKQEYLCHTKAVHNDYCHETWTQIVQCLLTDTSSSSDIISEKQFIIQDLVSYGKLNAEQSTALLLSFMANPINRRIECVSTVQHILIHANHLGLDKTSEVVTQCIQWICKERDVNEARSILMHIPPVPADLIATTSAVAVINLPNSNHLSNKQNWSRYNDSTELLLFKYNRAFVCLEQHGCVLKILNDNSNDSTSQLQQKSCLFQSNYEFLMRIVNLQPSPGTKSQDICTTLNSLLMIASLMKSLVEYDIFDKCTFTQCPLIKRIGIFLSHLELQFKSNQPQDIERSQLSEILSLGERVFNIFIFNGLMLQYLEMQPLEEMITFMGSTLKYSVKQSEKYNDCEEWPSIVSTSLNILATLCASTTHIDDCFKNISCHFFNLKVQAKIVIRIIKIFCHQKQGNRQICDWFVSKLKAIFQMHYTNSEVMEEIVVILPAIFVYVQSYDEHVDDMLVAVYSLMKVSFRKSYPCKLIKKIIDCIRLIARECRNIFLQENFKNICVSVVQFLRINSLEVRFAAVNTITALMDKNWHGGITIEIEKFFQFSDDIYKAIEWKKLQIQSSNQDEVQNCIAVNVQLLASLITFSHFHQNLAFQQLTYVCAFYKITEADLSDIEKLSKFYNISRQKFIKHCITNGIHYWIKKSYPILKFPYYLGYENKSDFLKDKIEEIIFFLISYDNAQELEKIQKYGTMDKLITTAVPLIRAILLYDKYNNDQNVEINNYIKNIGKLNISIPTKLDWKTLYYLLKLLEDDKDAKSSLKLSIFYEPPEWYNINIGVLQRIISNKNGLIHEFLEKNPLGLVKCLNALKVDCIDGVVTLVTFEHFYRFDVLVDSIMQVLKITNIPDECVIYFTEDIVNFILYILKRENHLELYALKTLNKSLLKMFHIKSAHKILNENFDSLCHGLFKILQRPNSIEIQELIATIFENIITRTDVFMQQNYGLLCEMLSNESIQSNSVLHNLREKCLIKMEDTFDWQSDLMNFLKNINYSHEHLLALKNKIRKYKRNFNKDTQLLYKLMKQLLEIVQDSQHTSIALEALKCLGEIGPLNLPQATYYFGMNTPHPEETLATNTFDKFYQSAYLILKKLHRNFKVLTSRMIVNTSQYLVNSVIGKKFLEKFSQFSVFQSDITNNYLNDLNKIKIIDWLSAVKSASSSKYDKWICEFVSHLFRQCGWLHFEELAKVEYTFAEYLLIPFTQAILCNEKDNMQHIIVMLDDFFQEFTNYHQSPSKTSIINGTIYEEKRIINVMLEISECMRVTNNWELPLKLLNVVEACNYCQAYFLSIIYLETWAVQENFTYSKDCMNFEIITNTRFQVLAKKAYESIGCTDAISGFLNPINSRCDYLNLTNNWPDIFIEGINTIDKSSCDLYASVLKRNGMFDFASLTNNNNMPDYEICWRLSQWETPVKGHMKINNLNDMEYEFQKHHFNALKCLYNREENNTLSAITNSLKCILLILKGISVDCLQSVYKYLTWLQMLQQIDEFSTIQFFKVNTVNDILDKWQMEAYKLEYGNFACKEQVLSHTIALFNTSGIRTSRKINEYYKSDAVEKCLLNCINECKIAGEINLATRYVSILKSKVLQKTSTSDPPIKMSALLEDAYICLTTGKYDIAKSLLQYTISNKSFNSCPELVRAYQMYGEYLLETNTDSFQSVNVSCFKHSMEILEKVKKSKDTILKLFPHLFDIESCEDFHARYKQNIHKTIAKYADREYTQLHNHINSDQFKMKQNIIEYNCKVVANENNRGKDNDKAASMTIMKRFTNLDKDEIHLIEEKRTTSLCIAMQHYIKYCCLDITMSSSSIYRIIALWFANQQNKELQSLMEKSVSLIPSYKFICGLNQVTARLNSDNNEFKQMLCNIIIRCVQEHPHHTLYKLYPFVYSHLDDSQSKTDLRSKIASNIIAKATTSKNEKIIKELQIFIPALIEFANTNKKLSDTKSIELSTKLSMLKNLDSTHCPTIELPINSSCKYNIIHIIKWETKVSLVGGINAPKKLYCLCSDGVTRSQLLKGKDDLRQDAVMQQIFHAINQLLEHEPEAKQRKLKLRTYKIVPLSMRSGILEWCQNTTPLGVYLYDAHVKYNPEDYTPKKCRTISATHLKSDAQKRFEIFEHICKNIKPVFHNFFHEKFRNCGSWFEKRYAYANSVATTSIVGFILGIGDRHIHNILVDETTGEVIHIDFGIAFEQGKVMPTPETVPFRLTRDIIAPMGVTGPNGIFKKSCEITLAMLRHHQDLITTILEVLLYDPLYMWNMIPQINMNNREEKNVLAQRALIVVQNKLNGKEKGIFNTLSISTHVERLINEAVSTRNLSMLFPGWDPYL